MIKNIRLSLLALAFGLLVISPSTALGYTVTETTVNGGPSATVTVGSTVSVGVTAHTTADWKSVLYKFATSTPSAASMTCIDIINQPAGTTTLTFPLISTPVAPTTYNLYVYADFQDNCSGVSEPVDLSTLPNALTVQTTPQTIDWTTISSLSKVYGDASVVVSATSTSGLPVTFTTSASADVCTVVGNTVTFTGAGSCPVSANQAGNGIYGAAPTVTQTFTIAPALLTLDLTGITAIKVYDGTTTATLSAQPVITGVIGGDDVGMVVGTYDTKTAVSGKTVTLSVNGPAASKYTLTPSTMTGEITRKPLTVVITATDKVYDGTDVASAIYGNSPVPGDWLVATGDARFDSKHVGNHKPVLVTNIAMVGPDAANYYVTNATTSGFANITPLAVTLTAEADTKTYDKTASSTGMPSLSPSVVSGDSYVAYQTFSDVNVGAGKTLTPFVTITDGNNGANYTVTKVTAVGSINAKNIGLGNISIAPKIYDKTTVASMSTSTTPTFTGVVTGDEASVSADFTSAVFTYDNENAGLNKSVTVTGVALVGTSSLNYVLDPVSTTGDIIPRPITVTAVASSTKVYDGNTNSAEIPTVTSGTIVVGDTESFTQSYADANAGTGKTVIPTGVVIDGNTGANYNVTFVNALDGVITPATLVVTALGSTKVYDGTTEASSTVTLFDNRISGADTFTVSFGSATYVNKHVGNGKVITISGLTKAGVGSNNYDFATTTIYTTGDITTKTLTATPHVPNKVYDTTTSSVVTYTDDRVSGDAVALTGTAAFIDKTAGMSKTVLLSPITFFGPDATNYTLSAPSTATADIYKASTTVSFTVDNKVYDATTTAMISSRSVVGILGSDTVTVADGSANFSDKHVGTGKTVTATGFTLGGADGNNYVVAVIGTTTANITKKTLTPVVVADDKIYDGTDAATVIITDDRITGDSLTINFASSTFSDKHVGTGKTVTATGFTISGTDAGNYDLSGTSGTDTANITALDITASLIATSKMYDATASATGTCSVVPVSGDDLSCTVNGTTTFADKYIGNGKVVTATNIALLGVDMGNYALTSTSATGTADIYSVTATVVFTANDKIYDGSVSATVATTTVVGIITGDDVTVSGGTATFDSARAGTGKVVTGLGFVFGGADATNYIFATTSTTTANVLAKDVIIGFTAAHKVFNGTTAAVINGRTIVSGLVNESEDVAVDGGVATFADADVGTGKIVSANTLTFSLVGTSASNYVIATGTATATADILSAAVSGSTQTFGGSITGGGFGGGLTTGTPISGAGTSTIAVCEAGFTKYMRFGRANDKAEVIKLQKFLNTYEGTLKGTKLPLTGFFGTQTRAAVIKFQAKYLGAKYATGLVLNMTIAEMNRMACDTKNN